MSDTNILALPIGHTFDGYRILRVLGAGGFGITYLAEEVQIGRKVAIKEYLPQGFAARAADSFTVRPVSATAQEHFAWGLDRFRKEAATLVAFEHPNIVSVYRYFEANGTAYLVMQYVEGKPLDALLAGGKTLSEAEIEEVVLPILAGLEQVHAARFLHRDIKPANIYIRRDGRPVLLDFGAARQAFGSETRSITAIVSEGYAPFEQYEAKGDQGPWTDVYALGAVLYRCVSGHRPPAAPERVSARLRGAPDPMPPAREAAAGGYSPRLLEAADRALAVIPAERPQTIAALRQLLGGRHARAESRVVSAAPSHAATTEAVTLSAGPARRKSRMPLLAGIGAAVVAAAAAAYFALTPQPTAPGPVATAPKPATPISATVPATPSTPPRPSPEEIAERAAKEAEDKANAELAALRATVNRGELARAREDVAGLIGRIEEALRKRPGHGGLTLTRTAALAAKADLEQRIAARVKELLEAAEREAERNYDEAQRLVAEAERLDAAAAKAARERIEQIRRRADDKVREDEKSRRDAEKRRAEEAEKRRLEAEKQRREEQERRARQERVDRHLALARYHLEQAEAAARDKRFAEARRVLNQAEVQVARAVEVQREGGDAARRTGPEPQPIAALRRDLAAFERELARKITDHVAALVAEARRLADQQKFDEAIRRLDEAAELEPSSSAVADARRAAEAARGQAEEEARRRAEAEMRRRSEAETFARIARQRLDLARAALQANRLAEARRLADDAAGTAKEAARVDADLPAVVSVRRDTEAFQRELARRIESRIAQLVQEARNFIKAARFDEADRRLDEAEALEPASASVTAARREFEEARKRAEDERKRAEEDRRRKEEEEKKKRAEEDRKKADDARKKAEEEKKREEAARPPTDPDAEQRTKTRDIVRDSHFDPRTRRGAAYFAFGKSELLPAAAQALARTAEAAKAGDDAVIVLCSYDQLEAANDAAGRQLAQERCRAAARLLAARAVPAPRIRGGIGQPGKGPDFRRASFALQAGELNGTGPAGRTGSLSRISPERRAVMRIHLQFAAGGALGVSCVAELADGGQSACFGQANGTGRWSLNGSTLCLASPVINLAANTCYQVSGGGSQLTLAGPGLLAGVMFLR